MTKNIKLGKPLPNKLHICLGGGLMGRQSPHRLVDNDQPDIMSTYYDIHSKVSASLAEFERIKQLRESDSNK